jgi:two-component system response regulator HupR/HoxA
MNAPELPPFSTADMPVVLLVDDEVRSLDAMRRTLDEDFRSSPRTAPTLRANC